MFIFALMPLKPLTIITLTFFALQTTAQVPSFTLRHYTTMDGLPQHSVATLAFDKAGFCWIGTEMGLVRFDGATFKVFNSNNTSGIRTDRFKFASFDSNGNLYIRNDSKQHFTIDENNSPRLLDETSPMCLMKGLSIKNAGLAATLQPMEGDFAVFNLQQGGIYAINNSVLRFATTNSFTTIYNIQDKNDVQHLAVGDLFLLFEHNTTIKAWKNGLLQPAIKDIQGPIQQNKDFHAGRFLCKTIHNQNYIYAGKTIYGITLQNGKITSKILLEDIEIPVISEIYYHEACRSYFIGSLVTGLYIVSVSDFSFPQQATDARDEGFYSQALTKSGGIICGRYLYHNGRAQQKLPLSRLVGTSLFLNKEQLYYGDEPQLLFYDLKTKIHKKIANLDSRPASIYTDKTDSNVVILTTSHAIGKMINDSLHGMQPMPFTSAIIRSVQTGKDSFLIATETGLKWYDYIHRKIYRSVLDSLYIRALYAEPNGRVWIGTYNKGSYLYEKGHVYGIPDNGYEALRTVHAFIEDNHGNFWMPTNDGLFTIKKELLREYTIQQTKDVFYHVYSVFDNLPTNEFNGGCTPNYIWTKDSLLSIPSIAGLVQFYPDGVQPVLPVNKIYVDELRLNDSIVQFSGDHSVTVGPDYQTLTISVSCPYYGARENLKLLYMAEGIDEAWNPVPADGKIELNRVAAGTYHFFVRKVTGYSTDDTASLRFTVIVQPPFYNTWWFRLLVLAALALIVFMLVKMRIRLLKERNLRLQAIIREQTADLNESVEQLRQSEQALKESNRMKDNVITMVLHDLRSPIRFLNTISSHLAKRYGKMKEEEIEEKLSMLKSGTESLNSFTEQFFAWAVSQQQSFTVYNEKFSLQGLFDELEELYSDIVAVNNNRLIIHATTIEIYTDKNILSAIIRNLLDNANKHTSSGTIEIKAEGDILISVIDSGTGLTASEIDAYYNPHKTAGQNGNGSIIVMNLLQKIDGKLTIHSHESGGAVFTIAMNAAGPTHKEPLKNQ